MKAFRQQHGKTVVGQITVDMVRAVGFCLEKELLQWRPGHRWPTQEGGVQLWGLGLWTQPCFLCL